MLIIETSPHFWYAVVALVLGLCSVLLVRMTHGRRCQLPCQMLFLLALLAVGVTATIAILMRAPYWPFCGLTFSCMVVWVTYDFSPAREAEVI